MVKGLFVQRDDPIDRIAHPEHRSAGSGRQDIDSCERKGRTDGRDGRRRENRVAVVSELDDEDTVEV